MKREGEQQKDDVLFKVRICTDGTGEWCIMDTNFRWDFITRTFMQWAIYII